MPTLSVRRRLTVALLAVVGVAGFVLPASAQGDDGTAQRVRELKNFLPPDMASELTDLLGPKSPDSGPIDLWLTVLHNNDGETRFQSISVAGIPYGGVARFKTLVDALRAQGNAPRGDGVAAGSVMVSSGDNFLAGARFQVSLNSGIWYDARALQLIGYDAIAAGNHDFDFGPDVLTNIISAINMPPSGPYISANLDFTNEPGLQALRNAGKFVRSTVVNVNGRQVGIIGAMTENLRDISFPRNTIINQVLPAVQAEANALTAQGVNIIILSSHLQNLNAELTLATQLTNVDLIIGGGGSELLSTPPNLLVPLANNTQPAPQGPYPILRTNPLGQTVPIVTTAGLYEYVGRLLVAFDAAGNLVQIDPSSNPRRVAGGSAPDAVVEDPTMLTQVFNPVEAGVAALAANVIGQNTVVLDGTRNTLRTREGNLGNLVADALLWQARQVATQLGQPMPQVAIQNAGGLRLDNVKAIGPFTELNTFDVNAFANFVTIVPNVSPQRLKDILEWGVAFQTPSNLGLQNGRFPQIAGMRIVYETAATRTAQVQDANQNITTPGTRIREIILNDGRRIVRNGAIVPNAPSVTIATIDFLSERNGDAYPFQIAAGPLTSIRTNFSYQAALFNYIAQGLGGQVTSAQYPNITTGNRIIRSN